MSTFIIKIIILTLIKKQEDSFWRAHYRLCTGSKKKRKYNNHEYKSISNVYKYNV